MTPYRRVAFLPDTFHEVNGVALTSRHLEAFARRKQIPFLSIHCGPEEHLSTDGALTVMQLQRGPTSFNLDAHLEYDPLLMRYHDRVTDQMKAFGAEVIHITGPGDMGTLGWYAASKLKLPLAMSWHTSLHEYAGRRLERVLSFAGDPVSMPVSRWAESQSLQVLAWFYRKARVVMAPNDELVDLMKEFTDVPVFLMQRGVETDIFSPAKRTRTSKTFRIGYVGRLTPEKNVRFIAELGVRLKALGRTDFEFSIIGQGSEADWLRGNVPHVSLPGVLKGEALASAYADMDLFVFPSKTDTFGNVVLEAMASGVPAVVTSEGGPKFLVKSGETGYIAADDESFVRLVDSLLQHPDIHQQMRMAARQYACSQSWDAVFEKVFQAYDACFRSPAAPPENNASATGATFAGR